jgi:hypothetical protein
MQVTNNTKRQNMNKHLNLFILITFFFIQISYGQTFVVMKGSLRKAGDATSEVIATIFVGQQVKIISGPVLGYYFVEYNGLQGYLNEMYLSTPSRSPTPIPSNSSSYSNPKIWSEYNLKEHWKTNGINKIEGIYESPLVVADVPSVTGSSQR